jgi:membrane fusion protein (multidrug efflux system)
MALLGKRAQRRSLNCGLLAGKRTRFARLPYRRHAPAGAAGRHRLLPSAALFRLGCGGFHAAAGDHRGRRSRGAHLAGDDRSVGTVRAARGILLSAETAGDITAMHVRSGDDVQAGQLLLSIDERAGGRHAPAYPRAPGTGGTALRTRRAPDPQTIHSPDPVRPVARRPRRRAGGTGGNRRNPAQQARDAPFAGRLGILQVRLGDYVEAGTPLATLQDLSRHWRWTFPSRTATRRSCARDWHPSLRTAAFPERRFAPRCRLSTRSVDEEHAQPEPARRHRGRRGPAAGHVRAPDHRPRPRVARVFVPETAVTYSLQGDTVYVIERG